MLDIMLNKKETTVFSAKYFKTIPVFEKASTTKYGEKLFNRGIIILDKNNNYLTDVSEWIYDSIVRAYPDNGTRIINWAVIKEESDAEFYFRQFYHYMINYAKDFIGSSAPTFLGLKGFSEYVDKAELVDSKMIILRTEDNFLEKIIEKIERIKAPSHAFMEDLKSNSYILSHLREENIVSNEIRIAYYIITDSVPTDGEDWLRYFNYVLTGSTLYVKNNKTLNSIEYKIRDHLDFVESMFKSADLIKLAEIFNRNKRYFMAIKTSTNNEEIRAKINKISKLSKIYHKPLPLNKPSTFTAYCAELDKKNTFISSKVYNTLNKYNNFDLIKILNSLNNDGNIKIYKIRNGKLYIKDLNGVSNDTFSREKIKRIVSDILYERFSKKFEGVEFYIPKNINYAAPVSEKQFVGNIPFGSSITLTENFVPTITWKNKSDFEDTDLDLFVESKGFTVGWNSSRNYGDIWHSGDMIGGNPIAAEGIFIPKTNKELLLVEVYNFTHTTNAKFDFTITGENKKGAGIGHKEEYAKNISQNNQKILFSPIELTFGEKNSTTLGLVKNNIFYFYGGNVSASSIPNKDVSLKLLDGISYQVENMLSLYELILFGSGKVFSSEKTRDEMLENSIPFIDLSPEAVTVDTFMNLIK